MHKNTARMPGSPGPQPRPGISLHAQRRIAMLEANPQRFAFLDDANGTRADAMDAMMGGAK